MPQDPVFVGIDVAKARLDVHLHPAGTRFAVANDRAGLKALLARLAALSSRADGGAADGTRLTVGFEASGGYERHLARALWRAGLRAIRLDPAQVRAFARAGRRRAKTDPIDAETIARCLAAFADRLPAYAPDEAAERLAEHVAERARLVAEAAALDGYRDTRDGPFVRRLIDARRRLLAAQLVLLDRQIARLIAADPRLAARARLITSAPGAGPVLAATLLARLPELGHLDGGRIAALVGVAPHARQSGGTDRGGLCRGGRADVRRVLYMATPSAVRCRAGRIRAFYDRLRAAGKPAKLAIVAAMRKFLTILNAMVRDERAWQPT
jgi:transposase